MPRVGRYISRLVFCPFSNLEGQWFWDDGELKPTLSDSRLYMICQRKELLFEIRETRISNDSLQFDLVCGDVRANNVQLPLLQFTVKNGAMLVKAGPKIIKIFEQSEGSKEVLRYWYTPDKLLFHYWRNELELLNPPQYRQFLDFKLHYVGISKTHDSLQRLYDTAHQGRSKILTLEKPMREGANISDEVTLLLFDFDVSELQSTGGEKNDIDDLFAPLPDKITVIADAEKAFVKLLNPKYCDQKYQNYPLSIDGLYNTDLSKYLFTINDPIAIRTDSGVFYGGDFYDNDPEKAPDSISVEGGEVKRRTFRPTDQNATSPPFPADNQP